jgi:hypothetical protein
MMMLTWPQALDLCAFTLPASAAKSYDMLQVGNPSVREHLALLTELSAITSHSDEAFRRQALGDLLGRLESFDDMWRGQIEAYGTSQEAILSLARTVCEKAEWSMAARLRLAQAEHTCANVASSVAELSTDVVAATKGLLAALSAD